MKPLSSVWWCIPLLALASIVGPGMASCLGQVLIHEIMYHPSSGLSEDEYVELRNIGPDPVDLTGWEFTRGIHFTFPRVCLKTG